MRAPNHRHIICSKTSSFLLEGSQRGVNELHHARPRGPDQKRQGIRNFTCLVIQISTISSLVNCKPPAPASDLKRVCRLSQWPMSSSGALSLLRPSRFLSPILLKKRRSSQVLLKISKIAGTVLKGRHIPAPHLSSWATRYDRIRGYIFCHHRAGPYCRASSNRDTRKQ